MRRARFGVLVLIVFGASAVLGAAPAGAVSGFSFPFDSSAEGWESTQDGETFATSAWSGSIGNPGGGISLTDENALAYDGFFSPESFGGDFGSNFGGTLGFDIASTGNWAGEEAGLALYGVAREELAVLCAFDESVVPGPGFQTAHLVLDGAHTYRLNLQTGACGTHPSDRFVSEVISSLLALYIPAEDVEGSGDTTAIDNVKLSGGAPLVLFTLTVLKAGGGSGVVNGPGIDCGPVCSTEIERNGTATLSASPGPGSTFAGWSGGGCSGTGACTVTASADTEVTAHFEKSPSSPSVTPPNPKALRCKKGFRKKKVHGRFRCVRHRKKHHHHRHHHG